MPNCVNCGLPVPEGQKVCSMCYGDPDYGSDGYYRQELERQREEEEREEERRRKKKMSKMWSRNDNRS